MYCVQHFVASRVGYLRFVEELHTGAEVRSIFNPFFIKQYSHNSLAVAKVYAVALRVDVYDFSNCFVFQEIIASGVGFVQWIENSDAVVAQTPTHLLIW